MATTAANVPTNRPLTEPHDPRHSTASASAAAHQGASPEQVRQWLIAGKAVLVDVREPDEHAREHIAGAQLMPLSGFVPARAATLARPDQYLVLHCRSGSRSADACRLASPLAAGGPPVYLMTGGIEAWKRANLPVTIDVGANRISILRQVQLVVGLAVLGGSALAWFVHPGFVALPAFFGAGLTFAGASGTCALGTLLGMMPWNSRTALSGSCASGGCTINPRT